MSVHTRHSQGGLSTTPGATPPRRRGGPTSSTAGPELWSGGSGTTSTTTAAPDCRESRLLLVKLISILFCFHIDNVPYSKRVIMSQLFLDVVACLPCTLIKQVFRGRYSSKRKLQCKLKKYNTTFSRLKLDCPQLNARILFRHLEE